MSGIHNHSYTIKICIYNLSTLQTKYFVIIICMKL